MLAHLAQMIDRTKKLPARFYVNSTGRKPVRESILDLPEADRHTVGKDIQKVEVRVAARPTALRAARHRIVGGTEHA